MLNDFPNPYIKEIKMTDIEKALELWKESIIFATENTKKILEKLDEALKKIEESKK